MLPSFNPLESVEHAESAIRGVKEAVKMQLLEFERLGHTLQFEKKIIQALLNYVCFSDNCLSPVQAVAIQEQQACCTLASGVSSFGREGRSDR